MPLVVIAARLSAALPETESVVRSVIESAPVPSPKVAAPVTVRLRFVEPSRPVSVLPVETVEPISVVLFRRETALL